MCGIAGILNLDGKPVDGAELRAFTRSLTHRGPDGEGYHTDGPLGLGHRRLSILDLSEAGKQPMSFLGGRYWITFNGEIYNFLELRAELEKKGQTFTTDTDTEVIVAAFHHWGPDCLLKFNGMWAFAIWDIEKRELFLSRDRFGVKPLHYMLVDGKRFVFASELKAFRELDDYVPRENEEELRRALLVGNPEAGEETFLKGVKRLKGGFNMIVSAKGVRVWKWWNTLDHLPKVGRTLADQAAEFKDLFLDACRLRLRSDVPVATCLSGGMDSSSVICSLAEIQKEATRGARQATDSHRAFVATYPGTPWDEREYAEAAVEKAGADARYKPMTPELAAESIQQYAYDFEGISYSLLVPLWLIYRELRRDGVYVSMDGHGADEILAGYPSQINQLLTTSGGFATSPARQMDLINTYRALTSSGAVSSASMSALMVKGDPLLRKASSLMNKVTGKLKSTPPPADVRASWIPPWTGSKDDFLDDDERKALPTLDPLNRILYLDFHHKVLPAILRNFDRCSMAHGVEMRMPFMDWRVVTYSFALPESGKVSDGMTKRVLREAMKGILPEKVRTRMGKIGFVSPMPNWFNTGLGTWVVAQVQSSEFLESSLWNGPAIRDWVLERHAAKSWNTEDTKRVWCYLQAHVWRQAFITAPAKKHASASATAS